MERESKSFAEGYNFYKIFWVFLILCIVGDLVEVFFCRFSMGRWMSRSSLIYGPFSIVWGLGGAILTMTLHGLAQKRDLYIFLSGTVLGGIYEYACSIVTETVFGARFWDYSKHSFNLDGRINLLFCFFWGMIALVWVKELYPRISGLIERIPGKVGRPVTWMLAAFLVLDISLSASALIRFSERQENIEAEGEMDQFLDLHFPDGRMIDRYSNIKLRAKSPSGEALNSWKSPGK